MAGRNLADSRDGRGADHHGEIARPRALHADRVGLLALRSGTDVALANGMTALAYLHVRYPNALRWAWIALVLVLAACNSGNNTGGGGGGGGGGGPGY